MNDKPRAEVVLCEYIFGLGYGEIDGKDSGHVA
jgi:hypothetical protein